MKKIIAENKINDALANKTFEKKAIAIQLFNEERKKKAHGKEFVIINRSRNTRWSRLVL